jgi:hypothetical protein
MWTINDFPVHELVSRWNTYRKLACSYCMKNNKAFTLMNGGKVSFSTTTRCFCQVINDIEITESIF